MEEAGGETAPAQRELVRGVEGFVPKWRSAATASPSLRSGARRGEGCRPGLSAGGPAGEGEKGAQPTRSGLPAPGQEGVGTLQSHRVPGGSAEPGLPALGGGGGWTWAEGAGVGKATGIWRLRLRGALSWLLGVFVSGTAAGAAGERSGG